MSGAIRSDIIYSDINLSLATHPLTKDITALTNEQAVRRSIKNILLTNYYESFFDCNFGCNLNRLLFENITPMTIEMAQTTIVDAITTYEPRANLIEVRITPYEDENGVTITIVFSIINREQPITMELSLDRIR